MASPSTQSEMVSSHYERPLFCLFYGGFTHALAIFFVANEDGLEFSRFWVPMGLFSDKAFNGWPRASIIDPTFTCRDDSSSSH